MTMPKLQERLKHVCAAAMLVPHGPPRLIESQSNDAWALDDTRLGPVVLRICWRGDIGRMARETAVLQQLPDSVRRPEVVGHGVLTVHGHPLSYSLTRRLTGRSLAEAWPGLTTAERRAAIHQTASMLQELHGWVPPAALADVLRARPGLAAATADDLVGADIAPLPVSRAVRLAEHVARMPYVDKGLMVAAVRLLRTLGDPEPAVDDPGRSGLVHGDLNLSNLLWTPDGTVSLLDFEWTRIALPSLDLMRMCEYADDAVGGTGTYPSVLRMLEEEYPDLFRAEGVARHVRLYVLAYSVRSLAIAPPDGPAASLPPGHALHRVRRIIADRWPAPGALPDSLVAAA
ncbi:phosphotransferase family protein [Streptomyces sp. NPDC002602]|uniref:phosphotransferase family protein n=1 Tax=Streptomyces sp. NPDC002602 TaxID=3364654 RepID=UPI0036C85115